MYILFLQVNCQDFAGRCPVHLAAENGHEDVAKILVVKGAQVDVEDKKGQRPLHLAARKGHVKMVKIQSNLDHINLLRILFE